MRPDLAKLTTEKERRGSKHCASLKYGGKVRIVHDSEHTYDNEYGGFRSSARHRHIDNKSFSDVLNPIKGALRKNVGRPWDKVYSEFCQHLDRRSVSGIHIFSHLCGRSGEVTINGLYVGDDGKIYEYPAGGKFYYRTRITEVDGFYVHPLTGILCYKPRHYGSHGYHLRAKLSALRDDEVDINEKKYRVINGCWFEVWTELKSKEEWHLATYQDKYDAWYKMLGYVRHRKTGEWGRWNIIENFPTVVRQRSLNSKEIKMVKKYQLRRIKELEEELR